MAKWSDKADEVQSLIDKGYTNKELAKHFNVSEKTVKNRLPELERGGYIKRPENRSQVQLEAKGKHTLERNVDGSYTSVRDKLWLRNDKIYDDEYILTQHGFNPTDWEIVTVRHNQWENYSDKNGITELYASKIVVKPKEHKYTDDDMMKFFERLSSTYESPVHSPSRYKTDGKLLELNIADLHLGKLAWSGDSGDTYNHEIARERFFYIINDVITRTKDYGFERVLFVWCNDFYHFDGPSKTTTNGTPQDASLQYEQMFELGCEMLVQAIDLLSQIAPVTTMYVASNHDRHVSYFATKYLYAWYRNNPNITIDSRALSRKTVRFGKCLIGFTHGDKEKKRIKEWMQVEYAPDWGETIYREVHAAHIHSERSIEEDGGQIIRYISSPTGTDKWHHNGAYVGAIQKGQAFIWDRENGLEDTKNTVIHIGTQEREAIVI